MLKRRSDAIYLTEMGAFIARRIIELAQTDPNRCAVLCANLGGDTDTIGAMATAICGALHGVNAIDPALKAELDAVNQLDFNRYATALAKYRQQREAV